VSFDIQVLEHEPFPLLTIHWVLCNDFMCSSLWFQTKPICAIAFRIL